MKCLHRLIGGIAAVSLLTLAPMAQAQPMGQGGGMGMGPGAGYGGGGMGQGGGRGFAFNNANTRGWTLMTPEERATHRDQMFAAKSYEECKNIQAAQHKIVAERATAQGKTLPAPRQNACDRMRARGFYK
jgi:hypothetical protein